MKIGSHEFVTEMPPLMVDELKLEAELHQHQDGRMHIYFGDPSDSSQASYDYTRVGFRDFGNETMLLGLRVASNLRGRDLGQALVGYMVNETSKRGQEFTGTGQIYKPLIALTLKRAGMQPLSDEVLVEILPWRKTDTSGTPKVQVIRNGAGQSLTGERASGGHFYEVVSHEEVVSKYPINSPEMIVALHTSYHPETTTGV